MQSNSDIYPARTGKESMLMWDKNDNGRSKTKNVVWRVTAAFVLTAFASTNVMAAPADLTAPGGGRGQFPASRVYRPLDSNTVTVPRELGAIHEFYVGSGDKAVVLIQDAHAVPEAQRNIRNLIDHFHKEFGIDIVAVEAAWDKFDTRIFRSFPEPERMKAVFEEYLQNGELTGPVAAAILSDAKILYYGIEDRALYEQGLKLYLEAAAKEGGSKREIERLEAGLLEEKQTVYSERLLLLDEKLGAFDEGNLDLLELLKYLAEILPPAEGSELALILAESKQTSSEGRGIYHEVDRIAVRVREAMSGEKGRSSEVRDFNARYQEFRTSRLQPESFAHYLRAFAERYHLFFEVSERLRGLMTKQMRLDQIRGDGLLDSIRDYIEAVKDEVIRTPEERMLDRKTESLRLLKRLARLELSRRDWRAVDEETRPFQPGEGMEKHLQFYKNAIERDHAFYRNLTELMKRQKTDRAILIAGGFHAEGLKERFKEEGISYLVIAPAIGFIPEETGYRNQMQGDVSWKDYYRVEGGRIDLYAAFVRAARDRLLGKAEALSPQASASLLKQWRDQIIRDLWREDRIAEAGQYTRWLDEAAGGNGPAFEADSVRLEWTENIEKFIEKFRMLDRDGLLTEANVANLLMSKGSTILPLTGAVLQPEARVTQDLVIPNLPPEHHFPGAVVTSDIMPAAPSTAPEAGAGSAEDLGAPPRSEMRTEVPEDGAMPRSPDVEAPAGEALERMRHRELHAIGELLRSREFAQVMGEWLYAAYENSTGARPSPLLIPGDDQKKISVRLEDELIATNIAPWYGLETGLSVLSERTGRSLWQMSDDLVKGVFLAAADMELLVYFMHAAWMAGQPFRGLDRIRRPIFCLISDESFRGYRNQNIWLIKKAAKKLRDRLRPGLTSAEEAGLVHELLKDKAFDRDMAEWMHKSYFDYMFSGTGEAAPAFLTTADQDAVVEKNLAEHQLAINLAGFYALALGVDYLSAHNQRLPSDILADIRDKRLANDEMLLLARFANATWKPGQVFRQGDRSQRDTFRPAVLLTPGELQKDFVQIRAAADKLADALMRRTADDKVPAQNLFPNQDSFDSIPSEVTVAMTHEHLSDRAEVREAVDQEESLVKDKLTDVLTAAGIEADEQGRLIRGFHPWYESHGEAVSAYLRATVALHTNVGRHLLNEIPSLLAVLTARIYYRSVLSPYDSWLVDREVENALLQDGVYDDDRLLSFLLLVSERLREMDTSVVRELTEKKDFPGLARYYFDRYASGDETFDFGSVQFQARETYQSDWPLMVEEAVLECIAGSRGFLRRGIGYEDLPDWMRTQIEIAQRILDRHFPEITKRPFPLDLKKAVLLSNSFMEHADPIAVKVVLYKDEHYSPEEFIHLIVHESLHLAGFSDEVFAYHDLLVVQEALTEYLTERIFEAAKKNNENVLHTPASKVYRKYIQDLERVFSRHLTGIGWQDFLDVYNTGDIFPLSQKVGQALQAGGISLATDREIRHSRLLQLEMERLASLAQVALRSEMRKRDDPIVMEEVQFAAQSQASDLGEIRSPDARQGRHHPDFFSGKVPVYWQAAMDPRIKELFDDAMPLLDQLAADKGSLTFMEIRNYLQAYIDNVKALNFKKAEHYFIPELAVYAGVRLTDEFKASLDESQDVFSKIIRARDDDERFSQMLRMKSNQTPNNIVVLKWLANTAELDLGRYPRERAAARKFLTQFMDSFFTRLGGREVLEAYTDLVLRRIQELVSTEGLRPDEILVAPLRTGADRLTLYMEDAIEKTGVSLEPLLFTHAIAVSAGETKVRDVLQLTGEGQDMIRRYLHQVGLIRPGIRHIIFLDGGRRGTFGGLLKQVLRDAGSGVGSDLLLIYHDGYTPEMRDWAYGLNDEPEWQGREGELWWFESILDDGFASGIELLHFQSFNPSEAIKIRASSNPRQWYYRLTERKFKEYAEKSALTEGPAGADVRLLHLTDRRHELRTEEPEKHEKQSQLSIGDLTPSVTPSVKSRARSEMRKNEWVFRLNQPQIKGDAYDSVRHLLKSRDQRPSPIEMRGMTLEGLEQMLANEYEYDIREWRRSNAYLELNNLLPYIHEISKHIVDQYSDHEVVVLARDAELFYDALSTMKHPQAVHLFGMSSELWYSKMWTQMTSEDAQQILKPLGITHEGLLAGKKYLILDTGYKGRAGVALRGLIKKAFNIDESIASMVSAQLPVRLVGLEKEGDGGIELSDPLEYPFRTKRIADLKFPERQVLQQQFPLSFRAFAGYSRQDDNDYYLIATAIQRLPKFHDRYYLRKNKMIVDTNHFHSVDSKIHPEEDVVNPPAALLTQKMVIDYIAARSETRDDAPAPEIQGDSPRSARSGNELRIHDSKRAKLQEALQSWLHTPLTLEQLLEVAGEGWEISSSVSHSSLTMPLETPVGTLFARNIKVPGERPWQVWDTGLADADGDFREVLQGDSIADRVFQLAQVRQAENKPLVLLDWGFGNGRLLSELSSNLRKRGVDNVIYIGFANLWSEDWPARAANFHVVFDTVAGLERQISDHKILFPERMADVIISYSGLRHLHSEGPVNYLSHLEFLSRHMAPDGFILTDSHGESYDAYNTNDRVSQRMRDHDATLNMFADVRMDWEHYFGRGVLSLYLARPYVPALPMPHLQASDFHPSTEAPRSEMRVRETDTEELPGSLRPEAVPEDTETETIIEKAGTFPDDWVGKDRGGWVMKEVLYFNRVNGHAVFRAEHAETDKTAALKVIRNFSKVAGQMARNGYGIIDRLRERDFLHVPELYGSGVDEYGFDWMAMEYFEQGNLLELLQSGRVSHERKPLIFSEILRAVQRLHEYGIFHRDLKPENIFLRGGSEVVLNDFDGAFDSENPEQPPIILHSPPYAPSLDWDRFQNPRSWDVYSLGVILYEICTGTPFDYGTGEEKPFSKLPVIPDEADFRDLLPAALKPLAAVIRKALAPSVRETYASVSEMLDDFNDRLTEVLQTASPGEGFVASSQHHPGAPARIRGDTVVLQGIPEHERDQTENRSEMRTEEPRFSADGISGPLRYANHSMEFWRENQRRKSAWRTGLWGLEELKPAYLEYEADKRLMPAVNLNRLEASAAALPPDEQAAFVEWGKTQRAINGWISPAKLIEWGTSHVYKPACELWETLHPFIDRGIWDFASEIQKNTGGLQDIREEMLGVINRHKALVHGTGNDATARSSIFNTSPVLSYHWSLLNIMLENRLVTNYGIGRIKGSSIYPSAYDAVVYGPDFVVMKRSVPIFDGRDWGIDLEAPNFLEVAGSEHAIYLVPTPLVAEFLRSGIDNALEVGILETEDEARVLRDKIMTYEELVKCEVYLDQILDGEITPAEAIMIEAQDGLRSEIRSESSEPEILGRGTGMGTGTPFEELLEVAPKEIPELFVSSFSSQLREFPDLIRRRLDRLSAAVRGTPWQVIGMHNTIPSWAFALMREEGIRPSTTGTLWYMRLNLLYPLKENVLTGANVYTALFGTAYAIVTGDDYYGGGGDFRPDNFGAALFPVTQLKSYRMVEDSSRMGVDDIDEEHLGPDGIFSPSLVAYLDLSIDAGDLDRLAASYGERYPGQRFSVEGLKALYLAAVWLDKIAERMEEEISPQAREEIRSTFGAKAGLRSELRGDNPPLTAEELLWLRDDFLQMLGGFLTDVQVGGHTGDEAGMRGHGPSEHIRKLREDMTPTAFLISPNTPRTVIDLERANLYVFTSDEARALRTNDPGTEDDGGAVFRYGNLRELSEDVRLSLQVLDLVIAAENVDDLQSLQSKFVEIRVFDWGYWVTGRLAYGYTGAVKKMSDREVDFQVRMFNHIARERRKTLVRISADLAGFLEKVEARLAARSEVRQEFDGAGSRTTASKILKWVLVFALSGLPGCAWRGYKLSVLPPKEREVTRITVSPDGTEVRIQNYQVRWFLEDIKHWEKKDLIEFFKGNRAKFETPEAVDELLMILRDPGTQEALRTAATIALVVAGAEATVPAIVILAVMDEVFLLAESGEDPGLDYIESRVREMIRRTAELAFEKGSREALEEFQEFLKKNPDAAQAVRQGMVILNRRDIDRKALMGKAAAYALRAAGMPDYTDKVLPLLSLLAQLHEAAESIDSHEQLEEAAASAIEAAVLEYAKEKGLGDLIPWVQMLRDPEIRKNIAGELRNIPDLMTEEALYAAARHADPKVRQAAVFALEMWGGPGTEKVRQILASDEDRDLRDAAFRVKSKLEAARPAVTAEQEVESRAAEQPAARWAREQAASFIRNRSELRGGMDDRDDFYDGLTLSGIVSSLIEEGDSIGDVIEEIKEAAVQGPLPEALDPEDRSLAMKYVYLIEAGALGFDRWLVLRANGLTPDWEEGFAFRVIAEEFESRMIRPESGFPSDDEIETFLVKPFLDDLLRYLTYQGKTVEWTQNPWELFLHAVSLSVEEYLSGRVEEESPLSPEERIRLYQIYSRTAEFARSMILAEQAGESGYERPLHDEVRGDLGFLGYLEGTYSWDRLKQVVDLEKKMGPDGAAGLLNRYAEVGARELIEDTDGSAFDEFVRDFLPKMQPEYFKNPAEFVRSAQKAEEAFLSSAEMNRLGFLTQVIFAPISTTLKLMGVDHLSADDPGRVFRILDKLLDWGLPALAHRFLLIDILLADLFSPEQTKPLRALRLAESKKEFRRAVYLLVRKRILRKLPDALRDQEIQDPVTLPFIRQNVDQIRNWDAENLFDENFYDRLKDLADDSESVQRRPHPSRSELRAEDKAIADSEAVEHVVFALAPSRIKGQLPQVNAEKFSGDAKVLIEINGREGIEEVRERLFGTLGAQLADLSFVIENLDANQTNLSSLNRWVESAFERLAAKAGTRKVYVGMELATGSAAELSDDLPAILEMFGPSIKNIIFSSGTGKTDVPKPIRDVMARYGITGVETDPKLKQVAMKLEIEGQVKLGVMSLAGGEAQELWAARLTGGPMVAIHHHGKLLRDLNPLERKALLCLKTFLALAVALEKEISAAGLLKHYGMDAGLLARNKDSILIDMNYFISLLADEAKFAEAFKIAA